MGSLEEFGEYRYSIGSEEYSSHLHIVLCILPYEYQKRALFHNPFPHISSSPSTFFSFSQRPHASNSPRRKLRPPSLQPCWPLPLKPLHQGFDGPMLLHMPLLRFCSRAATNPTWLQQDLKKSQRIFSQNGAGLAGRRRRRFGLEVLRDVVVECRGMGRRWMCG